MDTMVEICTWDEVFTKYREKESEIFVALYWYLFNKPDYQTNIARVMKKLREEKGFDDLPKSITDSKLIGKYLHEMEEYNLIARIGTDRKPYIFQALHFLYSDIFCIKTPNSRGKDILAHYDEYERNLEQIPYIAEERRSLREDLNYTWKFPENVKLAEYGCVDRISLISFGTVKPCILVPLQKIFQDFSLQPEEFTEYISPGRKDLMLLYSLIEKCFLQVRRLLSLHVLMEEERRISFRDTIAMVYDMLDREKISRIFTLSKSSIVEKYGLLIGFDMSGHGLSTEKGRWSAFMNDIFWVENAVRNQRELYSKVLRNQLRFNRERLHFERIRGFEY